MSGYVLMVLLGMAASTLLGHLAPETFPPPGPGPMPVPGLGWYLVTLAYSFVFAILGGHTCAHLARREELMHACVLAALIGALGLGLFLDETSTLPRWRTAGYLGASVGGVLLGGLIRAKAKRPDAT